MRPRHKAAENIEHLMRERVREGSFNEAAA